MSKIMYKGISYANAGVSSDATSIPTVDMTAAFDSNAHMNSTDMTQQEVEDFLVDINAQGTPSEYKKLLWTNPSPTTSMSSETLVASGADEYDAIEVIYKTAHSYNGYMTETSSFIAGSHITLDVPAGTTGEFTGNIYNACRTISMLSGGELRADPAVGMTSSGTTVNNNMCIPYKIYGIKYDRVAPPQAEIADCVIEQGTSGDWTYRKWNSGVSECWRTYKETTATEFSLTGSIYYRALPSMTFPTGLFNEAPTVLASGYHGNIGGCVASATASSATVIAWSAVSTARAVSCYIYAIGTWK